MKVFRDVFVAVLLGIMGGFLVTTVSYYNQHKEGGLLQTALAVTKSFDTVSEAYGGEDYTSIYSQLVNVDLTNPDTAEKVLQTFENVGENEQGQTVDSWLAQLDSKVQNEAKDDILAMDGKDGQVEEGMPYAGILRFHVRANSDSEEDQALKMAVKDDVVAMLTPILSQCKNVAQSKDLVVSNLQNIYTVAKNTIVEQGYDYEVKVYVTEEEFPVKTYGDLTFPAGDYQALRIDIGEAKGQNWWCVMYPPLCFIDESTAVVSEDGKKLLQENLTPEEYAALFTSEDVKIEPKLKIVEWWRDMWR